MRALALVLLGLVGCYDCPAGQTRYAVHGAGGNGNEFVCIPAPEPAAAATTTTTATASTAATSCAVTDAGTLDVAFASSFDAPQATETQLEANESFALTVAGGSLVEVCETSHGTLAASTLFPGGPGSAEPANLDWDETNHTLTLSIHAGTSTIVLEFVT